MDADLALVLGAVIMAFSIPSIISAWSDRRRPTASVLTVLIGAGLIFFAIKTTPEDYTLERIPHAVVEVVARFLP